MSKKFTQSKNKAPVRVEGLERSLARFGAHALLENGLGANDHNEFGFPALALACKLGGMQSAVCLLEAGADPNAGRAMGEFPLHCCAAQGEVEIAKLLVASGAKLENKNCNGNTALHQAAMHSKEMVAFLMEKGASDRCANNSMLTPAMLAIRHGKMKNLVRLFEGGGDPNIQNKDFCLGIVAVVCFQDAMPVLLEHGYDPKGKSQHGVEMPALAAAWCRDGALSALIRHGNVSPDQAVAAARAAAFETGGMECLKLFVKSDLFGNAKALEELNKSDWSGSPHAQWFLGALAAKAESQELLSSVPAGKPNA